MLEWPEGLPDQRCYRIDLGANIACLKGDTDCLVRSLTCDVNGDGLVDSDDVQQAKSQDSKSHGLRQRRLRRQRRRLAQLHGRPDRPGLPGSVGHVAVKQRGERLSDS